MWLVRRDMWHMTHVRWEEVNLLSKFQLYSSLLSGNEGLLKIFSQRISQSLNGWISDKGVCRTAPATPALLKRELTASLADGGILSFLLPIQGLTLETILRGKDKSQSLRIGTMLYIIIFSQQFRYISLIFHKSANPVLPCLNGD